MAKYLWLNNTVHETPDPEWTMEKAIERGLIPSRQESRLPVQSKPSQSSDPRQEAIITSLGSLAFEERSFGLEK